MVVKVRAVAMGHVMPLALLPLSSYLARPGTEVLKTPGEGVGVGMVGPVGSWEVPPVSPGLSHPLRGRDGVGVRVTAAVAIGRGLPCSHCVGCDRVWCMDTPPSMFLGEGWNPPPRPRAPVGCPSMPCSIV